MAGDRVRGARLCGEEPKRLALSDGSRLLLDGAKADGAGAEWRRLGKRRPDHLSVAEAADLAGDEFADYVAVRTRAEAEWLRAVGDRYHQEAARPTTQLHRL